MSACTCPGRRKAKIEPGTIKWFWRSLSHPSELCEDGGYDSPRRFSMTSRVVCLRCLQQWRTGAKYADQLPEPSVLEMCQIKAGIKHDGHVPAIVSEALAARSEARQQQVDYKMRAAGDA